MEKSLRTQFKEYMTLHRYSPVTIQHYLDIVKRLALHCNKSPDLITQEEIQEYLLYLYQVYYNSVHESTIKIGLKDD